MTESPKLARTNSKTNQAPYPAVVDQVVQSQRQLLFVTGRAGTGKSTLLRHLVAHAQKNTVVLAPTGAAAVEIGGQTIHSFFGFKPGITVDQAYSMGRRRKREAIFRKLMVLVIDEVSMVRADLLDCVDVFLQASRGSDEPFGGVQIVLFGDLYQLEPVVTKDEITAIQHRYETPYFFSSDAFQRLLRDPQRQHLEFIELETIYRQTDQAFIAVLDEIRRNAVTSETLSFLNRCVDEYLDDSRTDTVYLTATNSSAQRINLGNLSRLGGQEYRYTGTTSGSFQTRNYPAPVELELRAGARVMLTNNDPYRRWVNGTLGTVTDLYEEQIEVELDTGESYAIERVTWGSYKFFFDPETNQIEKKEIGSYEQFPLQLAWAMTIHKSQGKTFDRIVLLLPGRMFAFGQLYVALSRARSVDGIALNREIHPGDVLSDARVSRFLAQLQWHIADWKYPREQRDYQLKKAEQAMMPVTVSYVTSENERQRLRFRRVRLLPDEPVVSGQLMTAGTTLSIPLEQITGIEVHEGESTQHQVERGAHQRPMEENGDITVGPGEE